MTRLTRKLTILAVLLLTLTAIFVAAPPQSASAAICCENCPFYFDKCMRGNNSCHGDAACCYQATEWCYWQCTYC